MAYVPSSSDKDGVVLKGTSETKNINEKARRAGEKTRIVLNKGQVILRGAGVVALGAVAGVTLCGSLSGAVNIVGLAMHPNVYGIGEWISFGIPAVANVWVCSKTLPLFMKNCKLTKPIYDSFKEVGDSFKGGVDSYVDGFKEGYKEDSSKKR